MIILLFWCGVYSGAIWERKYLNDREAVGKLFRNKQRSFKASFQNIESADDAVQVFASEWCPACYMCWNNITSHVKMVWKILYTFQ